MFLFTADGSVQDLNGKVCFFSLPRFLKEICQGGHCFVCGADPAKEEFDDEHVLPNWLLKKYGLHDREISLPNSKDLSYGRYKIPCCKKCNQLAGEKFEHPIRELLYGGIDAVAGYLEQNGPWLFFLWLSLIFLKTHLKDTHFRFHLDRRKGEFKISDLHDWEQLHHVHCVARSFYTGIKLDKKVSGTLIILQAETESFYEHFDFGDNSFSKTILLRVGDVAFLAVLNDACAVGNCLENTLKKITGPLSPIQLRELMSRLAYTNIRLKERPRFYSSFEPITGQFEMSAELPGAWELQEGDQAMFGELMYSCCETHLSKLRHADFHALRERVKKGNWTFLFDENGCFIEKSMRVVKDDGTA